MPADAVETGAWTTQAHFAEAFEVVSVSFAIPLAEPIQVSTGSGASEETHVFFVTAAEQTGKSNASCVGSAEEPAAKPGDFCIYEGSGSEHFKYEKGGLTTPGGVGPKVGRSGAIMSFEMKPGAKPDEEPAVAHGSWAVSAP